jgi:hypothetical protein
MLTIGTKETANQSSSTKTNEGKATNREETTQPCLTEMTELIDVTTVAKLATSEETARQSHVVTPSPVRPGTIETRATKATRSALSNDHKLTW